jgi:alpha-glucosidase (family GH31 glycosyl hydrolase)
MAVTTYVNPMVCVGYRERYDQAAAAHGLTRDRTGAPYVYRYSTASRFQVSQFDLASGAGRAAFGGVLGEALADGYDGWMEDFGEYTPLDSVSAAGRSGAEVHNRYPVEYHCAAQDAAPRAGRFVRSGFTGSARCSPVVWGGDPTSAWGFDGLRSAVTNGLTMGLSGVGLWGSDIGGFFALGNNALSPELLTRWVELGFASGVMRTQADGIAVPAKPRPQVTDDGQLATWRRYAKLRTQLYPYLDASLAEYRRTGMPLMRHLALAAPADRRALAADDEFLLGPDLLVAPVLDQGARSRRAYLPRGRWIDLWRSARWDDRAGTLRLGRTVVRSGGRSVRLPAPLEQLPLLVRAGAVLPLTPADVDTLAPFGRGVVRLADRADRLRLLAFPAGRTHARFPGGRATSTVAAGRWTLRLRDGRRRTYAVEAALGASGPRRGTCHVTGATSWRYDRSRRVLRATVVGRGGRLTARGC